MEPFMIEIEPAIVIKKISYYPLTREEFIIVVEGSIEISYGKQTFILEKGIVFIMTHSSPPCTFL